jgi:ferredoxin-NAD(P)+ reductase (naphthalene dioxygenase ferredoxin-specific)
MAFRVSVPQLGAFDVGEDETIVEAATRHGIAFPFSCHSGTCGTCKSTLVSGDVTLLDYSKFTQRDEERAAGLLRDSQERLRCEARDQRQSRLRAAYSMRGCVY